MYKGKWKEKMNSRTKRIFNLLYDYADEIEYDGVKVEYIRGKLESAIKRAPGKDIEILTEYVANYTWRDNEHLLSEYLSEFV